MLPIMGHVLAELGLPHAVPAQHRYHLYQLICEPGDCDDVGQTRWRPSSPNHADQSSAGDDSDCGGDPGQLRSYECIGRADWGHTGSHARCALRYLLESLTPSPQALDREAGFA